MTGEGGAMSPGGFQICSWPIHHALDQRSNEFALFDRFPRPVAVFEPTVRSPTGRAGAGAAVDAAFSVLHRRAPARPAAAGFGSAAWRFIHLCHTLRQVSVHRVDSKIFEDPAVAVGAIFIGG